MKHITLFLLLNTCMFADTIGGEISMGIYGHSVEGTSQYKSQDFIDVKDTLGFESTQDVFFKAYIEHPLPLVPNVRFAYHTLAYKGEKLVSSVSWGEIQNFTGNIDGKLSLDYTDITLYYELLDNWAEVDTGLTFRSIKGDMFINSRLFNDSISYAEPMMMLYGKVRTYIPSTDISLQAEINLMPLGDISSYDMELSARYSFTFGLGVELGYKSFYLESDALVNGLSTELTVTGPYAAIIWDF